MLTDQSETKGQPKRDDWSREVLLPVLTQLRLLQFFSMVYFNDFLNRSKPSHCSVKKLPPPKPEAPLLNR